MMHLEEQFDQKKKKKVFSFSCRDFDVKISSSCSAEHNTDICSSIKDGVVVSKQLACR